MSRFIDYYIKRKEAECEKELKFDFLDELAHEKAMSNYLLPRFNEADAIIKKLLDRESSLVEAKHEIWDLIELAYSGGFLAGALIASKMAKRVPKAPFVEGTVGGTCS